MLRIRLSIISVLSFIAILFCAPEWGSGQRRPGIETSVNLPDGCFVIEPVDTENIYSYVRTEIQALAFARDGELADRDLLTATGGPPIDKMARLLAGLRKERINNSCAGFVISPYAQSRNEYIASSAGYLVHAYEELGKMTDQMLQLTLAETMLQKAGKSSKGEFARLKNERRELLRYMAIAIDIPLSLPLDARQDTDGKHDHMVFTATQRDELLKYLYSQFPALKNKRAEANSGYFTEHVARIQSFLSGEYKPSDQ